MVSVKKFFNREWVSSIFFLTLNDNLEWAFIIFNIVPFYEGPFFSGRFWDIRFSPSSLPTSPIDLFFRNFDYYLCYLFDLV